MLGSLVAVVIVLVMLQRGETMSRHAGNENAESIMLFCAASNRAVVEEVLDEYERECGRTVAVQYGPSQTLLSSLEVSGIGDLYLPADDSYLKMGSEKGLIAEMIPIATMRAVVVVKKGNAKQIHSFDDLLKKEIRLVQASPESAAIGKITRETLQKSGHWDRLQAVTIASRATVNEVANDVAVGAADAGIVYDAVLHTYPDLTFVELPELVTAHSRVAIGVLKSSHRAADALHLARFLSASDRGLIHYEKQGFEVTKGDPWEDEPKLSIFAGSMLRPAIEETITEFERREGVRVDRVYNGCGILVAQMKAGQQPDAYFACDSEFMNQVHDLFPNPVAVSQNQLVILVPKGNPKKIASLKDLTRSDLRVGVGHEKQCAMGWLTQNTFREGGVQKEIMENVTVQTPTGDMLVNQLQTGALDAAVAYLSNAVGAGDFLDAIAINDIKCSTATQPWAIAKSSRHGNLAGRLFEKISSADSQEAFAAEGFQWQLDAHNLSEKKSDD